MFDPFATPTTTPQYMQPPLKYTRSPWTDSIHSSPFARQHSDKQSKSNWHRATSNNISSSLLSARMLWTFFDTTCNLTNSSWTASFMVLLNGPRTVEHARCLLPWCVWTSYSIFVSSSAIASLTVALTNPSLSIHSILPSVVTMATLRYPMPSRRRTWNHL